MMGVYWISDHFHVRQNTETLIAEHNLSSFGILNFVEAKDTSFY